MFKRAVPPLHSMRGGMPLSKIFRLHYPEQNLLDKEP
jgi:hypothetical protein